MRDPEDSVIEVGALLERVEAAAPIPLEPGDRIIFVTDGMQEHDAASLDVATALVATAALHPRGSRPRAG